MTSSADPALVERLAETRTRVHDRSAGISEQVKQQSQALAAADEERRQANIEHSAELDRRAAERAEGKEDPAAKNQWFQRAEPRDTTFRFGDADEEPDSEPASPSWPPEPVVEQPRGRHSRDADFDDDDFSNNSWLQP